MKPMGAHLTGKRAEVWLRSAEVCARLRISGCELMHLREGGELRFRKQGNAFLYSEEDVAERDSPSRHCPGAKGRR